MSVQDAVVETRLASAARLERLARVGLAIAGAMLVGYALHAQFTLGGHGLDGLFQKWVNDAIVLICAAACFVRAWALREERLAWLVIGLGMASWALGNLYWTLFLIDQKVQPIPSVADALWLGIYPFSYVGVGLLVRSRCAGWRSSMWFDGVIAGTALGAVSTHVVVAAVLKSDAHSHMAMLATNLAYPIGDLFLVALVVGAIALAGWRFSPTWLVLTAGFATFTVTDGAFLVKAANGTYVAGTILDAGWLLAALLVALSAWQPITRVSQAAAGQWRRVMLPCLFAVVSIGVLVGGDGDPARPVTVSLASAGLIGVLIRMVLTYREYLAIARDSDQAAEAYRTLVANIPGAVYRCALTSSWDMEFLSGYVEEMTGYPAGEFLGPNARSIVEVVHPDDRQPNEDEVARCVEQRKPFMLDYRMVRADGEIRFVHEQGQAVFGQGGEVRYLDGVVIDVTEQHDLIERLAASQARYAHLVENMPLATYTNALDGHMTYISDYVLSMLGYPPEAWTNHPGFFESRLHPDDHDRVVAQAEHCQRAELSFEEEYRLLARDGSVVWVLDRTIPMYDSAGNPVCRQGFLLDVTDRKRGEAEQRRLEGELRLAQKLESVGQLAAGIAHEINTPIQFVGDSAHFLQDAFADLLGLVAEYRAVIDEQSAVVDASARVRVASAEASADVDYLINRVPPALERTFDGVSRVATIVRAMKEFAHPSADGKAPADLNRALESTLVIASNEIRYVADVEVDLAEIPEVVCQLGDLNQVFLNLIVNAAHAMDQEMREQARGRLTVRTRSAGEYVVIEIGDTGCGIPADIQDRVFDQFFTTKEVGKGTGQGLALARAVIQRHGGTLTFQSAVGAGTTFTITLPITPVASPALEAA